MFTVFEDVWISAGFGILWGFMIFNLDRYIVSSIKKRVVFGINFSWQFQVFDFGNFSWNCDFKPLELKILKKKSINN